MAGVTQQINATKNFTSISFPSLVTRLKFTNIGPLNSTATATFASGQFDDLHIAKSVIIQGNTVGTNKLVVNVSGSMDASGWTFETWLAGTDTIAFNGSANKDTIVGSTQNDSFFGGNGDDTLHSSGGKDVLRGGDGDDRFIIEKAGDIRDGTILNGDAGSADTIVIEQDGASTDLNKADITNIENLEFAANAIVDMLGSQIGNGKISSITGNSEQNFLTTRGSLVDLSAVAFENWAANDQNSVIGTTGADSLTGSAKADRVTSQGGADTIKTLAGDDVVLLREGGFAGTTVNGGTGTDTLVIEVRTNLLDESTANTTLSGVNILSFADASTSSATVQLTMKGSQIGGDSALTRIERNFLGGSGVDAITLTITGSSTNLSNITINGWTAADSIIINGTDAADTLLGSTQKDKLLGGDQNDLLKGFGGNDVMGGGDNNDTLFGGDGNDTLKGNSGADDLNGGAGDDKITGGTGRDLMHGDSGKDTFIFAGASDSIKGSANRDIIFSFGHGTDHLSFTAFDANVATAGVIEAFTFIGKQTFSGAAGELRFTKVSGADTVVLSGNIDGGNTDSDFQIEIRGIATLEAGDLLL